MPTKKTPALQAFFDLVDQHDSGGTPGLASICSAHPWVIRASLEEAQDRTGPVVIEATCNQVNQDGGYTGMTPVDFRDFVWQIAAECGFDTGRILLGGDHLGPNPWRDEPADVAMDKAQVMVFNYAKAGFSKIHLDASMACADDPTPLPPKVVAQRAAALAARAEAGAVAGAHPKPGYIIGTEVPVPGGATHALDAITPTRAADAAETIELHQASFNARGLGDVLARVVGIVVQPGVEFGHSDVIRFDAGAAAGLVDWRRQRGGIVFEAHSTDYQTAHDLRALVTGGFAILKVGPGLTFAMREALYGLDNIAGVLVKDYAAGSLPEAMEALMLDDPADWRPYYGGSGGEAAIQRHFSYSDRIRYYWGRPAARKAVDDLMHALGDREIPETLISQFLSRCYDDAACGRVGRRALDLVLAHTKTAIAPYTFACETAQITG
ncbi:MAG TPA: D-tagatose-bisphosphate aldolase, class II, non-catalytic subunit [Aliiroseovarius sp.]|nr:D-tagatose-bisphosphate aldolase, class II, non-catalytic subunit [Aliiroseovarius sp.]